MGKWEGKEGGETEKGEARSLDEVAGKCMAWWAWFVASANRPLYFAWQLICIPRRLFGRQQR